MPETMPFEAKRLITKMLSVDPSKRPTAKEVSVIYVLMLYSFAKTDGYVSPDNQGPQVYHHRHSHFWQSWIF